MDRTRIEIGNRIRQVRMFKEMKQEELAEMLGSLSNSSVSAYEKGTLAAPRNVLEVVAQLAELEVEDIENGGERFERLVGSKVNMLERKRIRSSFDRYRPTTAADIEMLVDRMESFKDFAAKIADRILENREALTATPLRRKEAELLEGFRKLPLARQNRILDDVKEWLEAYNMPVEDLFTAAGKEGQAGAAEAEKPKTDPARQLRTRC